MSDAKSIAKNVASLYIGEVLSQILTFFLVITIAGRLGDSGLGKYSFAFSFAALFLIIADMGLPTLVTKEVAKDRALAKLHLTKTLTLKIILNIAAFFITMAAIWISKKDAETIILVAFAAAAMFFYNLAGMYRAIFQAYEAMKYESLSRIVERAIASLTGIMLLYKGYGIISLFVVFISSNAVYYILLYMLTKAKVSNVKLEIDTASWKKSMKESLPFWLTTIFLSIYFRIDTIMLGFMKNFADTGLYNAAAKIIEVITRIPFLLITAVFPTLSKFHKLSYDKTKLLFERSFYYMFLLALPISIGLIMLGSRIISYVYPAEFSSSFAALQILAASLIFVFINYLMGFLLNAIDKQKLFTLTSSITTVLNVILNIFLIPKHSYIGASYATLISEAVNFFMLYYFTSRNNFGINLAKTAAKPVAASLAMIFSIAYLKNLHLLLVVGISSAVYFAALLLIKGIGKEELNMLKSMAQRK